MYIRDGNLHEVQLSKEDLEFLKLMVAGLNKNKITISPNAIGRLYLKGEIE